MAFDNFGLDLWAAKNPEKPAIIDENYTLTYGELQRLSRNLASNLLKAGADPDTYLLICVANCAEFSVIFYAAMYLQIPVASVNPLFRHDEIANAVHTAKPKLGFYSCTETKNTLLEIDPQLQLFAADFHDREFQDLLKDSLFSGRAYYDESRICSAIYTSGSSDTPKFAVRSYHAQLAVSRGKIGRMHGDNTDVLLVALPLAQQFGQGAMEMGTMMGGTTILMKKFHAKEALHLIEYYRITLQFGVPTMFIREMNEWNALDVKSDLSSLKSGIISGAKVESTCLRFFEDTAGCRLLNNYGCTETGGITLPDYSDSRELRYSSSGYPIPGAEIRIISPDGTPLPQGEIGEILCHSESMMEEYLGDSSFTSQCFISGRWFRSGDLGWIDENGCLCLAGRTKDLIIRGGYNILPAEIEKVYQEHPDILEICVMGVPDFELGEKICAFIRLREGSAVTDSELRAFGTDYLAKYKLPDYYYRITEMPLLETQKYNKRLLKNFFIRKRSS